MNKFVRIFVALLATVALATPALAIDANIKGFFQARGIAYDNLNGDDDVDDNARGVDQRMRLWIDGAANENVKMVLGLEIDNAWGDLGRDGDKEVGRIGSDAKGEIEVKHIYLDFNLTGLDTNVKAGTQGWSQGRGYLIGDDAAGLKVVTTLDDTSNIAFFWIKTDEGDKNNDAEDGDYYSVQFDTKVNGWSIVPFYGFYDVSETGAGSNKIHYFGVSADGKVADFGLSATAIFNDWDVDGDTGNGYVFFAKGTYAAGATTFSAEAGYMGDSDAADGQFVDVSNYNNFSLVLTGGKFDNRGTIGAQAVGDTEMNWLYGKVTVAHKYNEKHSVQASLIHAEEAEDTDANGSARTFGQEIDAYYNYNIMKGLVATLGAGYLLTDDDFGAGDDAWKVGSSLTYKF